jgi:small-conductance mechanosensitive channel
MLDKFIQIQTLYSLLDLEPYILIATLVLVCWLIYKIFLKQVSEERHRNMQAHLRQLFRNFVFMSVLFVTFLFVHRGENDFQILSRFSPYIGLLTVMWGMIIFVKSSRLLVLEYLFMGSMRAGVPVLVVNIFSLLLSAVLVFWLASRIFGLQLAPLLATSAAFSIILGLALQDTLGNLFAGISLQIDRNYEIGDWLEVINGAQKAVGQVKEITWRSTLLVGFSEELVIIPNRVIAQAQISNYSPQDQPIVRSQVFRVPHNAPVEKIKEILETAGAAVEEVRNLPAPFAYVLESTESWLTVKLIYFIDSYGAQFLVGDKVLRKGIEALAQNGIDLAKAQLRVETQKI